jgi:tripartite-type tricarboxylate transporter receptor subunit TctC
MPLVNPIRTTESKPAALGSAVFRSQFGTKQNVVARLNAAINKVLNTADVKEPLNRQGFEPQGNTPEQFAALIHNEIAQNTKLIKLIGLKAE